MRFRLLPITIFAFLLISYVQSFAQESDLSNPLEEGKKGGVILIGPCAGYNRSLHSLSLSSFNNDVYCPVFKKGDGSGFFFGLTYELPFGKADQSTTSLIFRAVYSTMPFHMTEAGDDVPSLVVLTKDDQGYNPKDPNQQIINSKVQHTMDISYNIVSIEAMYKYNIDVSTPIGFTAGPTIDIPITRTLQQKMKIIESSVPVQFIPQPGYKYADGGTTLLVQDGAIKNASSLGIGLKIGVHYEYQLQTGAYSSATLMPYIYYKLGLLKVTSSEDWRINMLQIGFDLRFGM